MDMGYMKCLWCEVTGHVKLLATTNEFDLYCDNCKQRYNSKGQLLSGSYPPPSVVTIHQEQDDLYGKESK